MYIIRIWCSYTYTSKGKKGTFLPLHTWIGVGYISLRQLTGPTQRNRWRHRPGLRSSFRSKLRVHVGERGLTCGILWCEKFKFNIFHRIIMVAFSHTKNKLVQATDQDQEGREHQNLPIDYMWALTPYASWILHRPGLSFCKSKMRTKPKGCFSRQGPAYLLYHTALNHWTVALHYSEMIVNRTSLLPLKDQLVWHMIVFSGQLQSYLDEFAFKVRKLSSLHFSSYLDIDMVKPDIHDLSTQSK